jgi:putative transcriptional regulator
MKDISIRPLGPAFVGLLLLVLSLTSAHGQSAKQGFLEGRLLVATESLADSFFSKTVIFMVEHDERGAFGLIVNRSLGVLGVKPMFETLGLDGSDAEGEVLARIGGPVEPGAAFILHSDDIESPGGKPIAPGLAMTTQPEILKIIGKGEGPNQYLFAFGYSGWGPGQLEDEIMRGSWIDVPLTKELLFGTEDAEKWRAATNSLEIHL